VHAADKSDSFGLSTIGQIALPVTDLDRAVQYYRDRLGLAFLFQAPPALAFFDCAGLRLMLDRANPDAAPGGGGGGGGGTIIYFKVEDLDAAYDQLASRGVVFDDAPHLIHKAPDHELWMCFFHDSEGNLLALMSEVR